MIKIGGHVSAAGGPLKALARAKDLDFPVIQIHPTAPQSWASPNISAETAQTYLDQAIDYGVQATYFHNIYLINLASLDPDLRAKSVQISRQYLELGARMGAAGVITHLGSHKGAGLISALPLIIESLEKILDGSPQTIDFMIENTAGAGGTIGKTLEEIQMITDQIWKKHANVSLCFDTCHSFASGIPLHTPDGQDQFFNEVEERFGLDKLSCFHLNDCVGEFGDNKDRHANLGQGNFGKEGFKSLFHHPQAQNLPFIMEVPGFAKTGPDAINLKIARQLAA